MQSDSGTAKKKGPAQFWCGFATIWAIKNNGSNRIAEESNVIWMESGMIPV